MIIKSIKITEGMFQRNIDFACQSNLIFSKDNSSGKTTLLRLLLFSLGYTVPSTKNIQFEKCETETTIQTESELLTVFRHNDYLEVKNLGSSEKQYYVLPSEFLDFQVRLFETDNMDILNNILGAFYIDQEKGWTLLNRGTVIGKIHFNIEQLVRGLSDRSCAQLEEELKSTEQELSRYKEMFSIAEYQRQINILQDNVVYDTHDEEAEKKLIVLRLERKSLSDELKRLNSVIQDNNSFKKFIERMRITVCGASGELIPVNADTIVGFTDNIQFLLAKRQMLVGKTKRIDRQIASLSKENEQQQFLDNTKSLIESFDQSISEMKIDSVAVNNVIAHLEKERKKLRQAISKATKYNNDVITALHETIMTYAEELEFTQYIDLASDYIFTDDLKSLSGAILHKIVFSFKLSYITALQKKLGIRLPIILDSPSGREVTRENVEKMIRILNRDFSDNQIIIASVFHYDLENLKIIELHGRLIDEPVAKDS
ncbi:MAG: hypothetical protein GXY01_02025 [Clostridiales bacterium]|jgi:hypothetical protein|nr:hypothetical protein [Clostridiales bacterium]